MNVQMTLAARYLSGRKLRTALTTLAVVFGVLVLFGMNIIMPSMMQALQTNAMAAAGQVDVSIQHGSGEPFDAAVLDKVKAVDGVQAASGSLERTINLPADFYDHNPAQTDRITALNLVGINPYDAKSLNSFPITSGRYLQDGDGAGAVITQSLADQIGVKVGEEFPIPTTGGLTDLTVTGILPPRTMPGNEEVFVTLPEAQAIADQPGKINLIDLNLNTTDETRRKEIVANIESVLGKEFVIGAQTAGSEMQASLQLGQQMFNLLGALALFMGGFIIFNTFRTIVVERRRDIGMLRALGADQGSITRLILMEGLLQGAIGTGLGLLLGYLLAFAVLKLASPVLSKFVNLKLGDPIITPSILIVSIVLGVGITVLAGLLPAIRASRITPLEALRPSVAEVEFKRQAGWSFIAGVIIAILSILALFSGQTALIVPGGLLFLVSLVLMAPGLVRPLAIGFGWLMARLTARSGTGDLAEGNLTRQPSRTAITVSASMLALAIVVAAGGMVGSLSLTLRDVAKKSLGSDYLFIPPSIALWNTDIGAKPDFANQLRQINGVADVSTLRFAGTTVAGQTVSLMGIDPVEFPKLSGLSFINNSLPNQADVYQALGNGRTLIANGAFMALMKANVGDTVTLQTPNGSQSYKIVAVASDLLNAKVTTAYISQANMSADFGKSEDVFLQLNLKPGADQQAADKAIRSLAANYPQFNLIEGKSYVDSMISQLDIAFAGLYILLAMLALPSLIATLNTLAISVIERTREIGMIRAVGSTQAQVRMMVLSEALILAGIGTAFGLAGGMYLGYMFVKALETFFPLGYVFPTAGIIAAIVIGLGFGALSAIIPARQAAKLEIVRALRYE